MARFALRLRSIIAAALLATAMPCDASPGSATDDGLSLYMQGRDQEALRILENAERRGELTSVRRLALADLYFMSGRSTKATTALEAAARDTVANPEFAIWFSWIDFASGRAARGSRALSRMLQTDTDDPILRGRTQLSLAWQLLLRGRTAEAAGVLDGFEPENDFAEMRDQATLLKGQALLWAGRLDEAERMLEAVDAQSLRPDAARDLAWIHFQRGESELAATELRAVIDGGDTGRSPLRASWARALRFGPQTLKRAWSAAYRKRPRGQDPTLFLTTLTDRDAARDAEELVAAIETGGIEDGIVSRSSPLSRSATARPDSSATLRAASGGDGDVRPARVPKTSWLLVLCCSLAAFALVVHRRPTRPTKRSRKAHGLD